MSRSFLLILLSVLLAGCAHDPYENYDPNAIKLLGVILEKKIINTPDEEKRYQQDTVSIVLPGIGLIFVPTGNPYRQGDPYLYKVSINNGNDVEIVNHFGGFSVGECVQVFVSTKFPIRLSSGSGCIK